MSLFYPNNLLNSFLHRFDSRKFPNPLCHCGEREQTNYHISVECNILDNTKKTELTDRLKSVLGENDAVSENAFALLNSSRDPKVLSLLVENMEVHHNHLRTDIEI